MMAVFKGWIHFTVRRQFAYAWHVRVDRYNWQGKLKKTHYEWFDNFEEAITWATTSAHVQRAVRL